MKNRRFKSKRAHREAEDLVRFIEAHGGKLGAFRSYRAGPEMSPPPDVDPHETSSAHRHEEEVER